MLRYDYGADVWQGCPEEAFAWWKSRVPAVETEQRKLAPTEVLLALFEETGQEQGDRELRYVLALLLVRRRVLQLLASDDPNEDLRDKLRVVSPVAGDPIEVDVCELSDEKIDTIQEQLASLLYADG